MKSIDVGLLDVQIQQQLATKCSKFANIKLIRLLPRTDVPHRFAFIEVVSRAEMLKLAAATGGNSFGSSTVVIRLDKTASVKD